MASQKLITAAGKALKDYMGVTKDESVLIISDEDTRPIGIALHEAGISIANESFYIEMKKREVSGQEPPAVISETMKNVDVVICATSKSLTHTDARRGATAKGVRVGTMPGITTEILSRCFAADSNEIINLNNKLIALLKNANEVKITTKKGTNATFKVKGRRVISSTGVLKNIGD